MMQFHSILGISAFLLIWTTFSVAQDNHYWTQEFGSRSALMGGAVVAGVRDTSATYYNPAAMSFLEADSLSVSANAYQFQQVDIESGAGPGLSLESDRVNNIPLLISGSMYIPELNHSTIGYALLARNRSSIKTSARREATIDVIDNSFYFPNKEEFVGQFLLDAQLTELWGGITWAQEIDKEMAWGVSGFLSYRDQSQNESITAIAINGGSVARTALVQDIEFYNIRGLLKFGWAADLGDVKFGATVTTPSFDITGNGTVAGEFSSVNGLFTENGVPVSLAGTDRQSDLNATYKTPFSIAFGMDWLVTEKTRLAIAMEWFQKQKRYAVLAPQSRDFIRGSSVTNLFPKSDVILGVETSANSVLNIALALEQEITSNINGYISIRTDNNARQTLDTEGLVLGISDWDILHLTLGGTYRSDKQELAVGLTYSFGNQDNYRAFTNLSGIQVTENSLVPLLGEAENTQADYSSMSLIVGYTYFFE